MCKQDFGEKVPEFAYISRAHAIEVLMILVEEPKGGWSCENGAPPLFATAFNSHAPCCGNYMENGGNSLLTVMV